MLARRFANESYLQTVKLYRGNDGDVDAKATAYRSQKKSDTPHAIIISIGRDVISEAHCTCKAGYDIIVLY
mgnify:FL=1